MNFSSLVFGSIALLIRHYSNEQQENHLKKSFATFIHHQSSLPRVDTYDFIVVGGGTAGCVVASRLSENPNFNVLLLEIGGTPPPQTEVPGFMREYLPLPETGFQYNSTYQNDFITKNFVVRVGKLLGGTSTINAMFFNRGNPLDFDNWAHITGDDSWKYNSVLPYFKKSEGYHGDYPFSDQHGSDGPIPVTSQKYAPGLSLWLDAGHELGYPNCDPNGLGPIEFSKWQGRRVNSYDGYIRRFVDSRKNLKISKYSEAEEIILENGRAVGVTYRQHGVRHFVKSSKEIILSAGSFGTSMLLQKSGIGPAEDLEAAGISMIADLPVGKNLREHPLVPLRIIINDTQHVYKEERDITEDAVNMYLNFGEGPLSADKTVSAQGFAASRVSQDRGIAEWPDIQFSLYSQDFTHLGVPTDDVRNNGETGIYVMPYLSRPRSVGTVKLDPVDISRPPVIDFNLLSDSDSIDLQIYIEGVKKSLEIFETTSAYKQVGARYSTKPLEGCAQYHFRSDDYWACYIKHLVFIGNHASGTCRMGRRDDPNSVVDSKLRVRGIDGLRVADASVMPEIVNANPQATVYMIAEKLSAELMNQWDPNSSCESLSCAY